MDDCEVCFSAGSVNKWGICEVCGEETEHESTVPEPVIKPRSVSQEPEAALADTGKDSPNGQ